MRQDDFFAAFMRISRLAFEGLGKELADEFEVNEATIDKWTYGWSNPHPRLKNMVVESILKRARYGTKARTD